MKGLLRNNYYSMQEGMKLSAIIILFIAVFGIFLSDALMMALISAAIFMFPLNIGASLQADETSKWNKFEITMPVSRRIIVRCKYLSYLMLVLIGLLCSFGIVLIYRLLGQRIEPQILVATELFGLSVTLFTGSIMYPLLLKLGALRSEMIIVISVMAAVGAAAAILNLLSQLLHAAGTRSLPVTIITCAISFFCFLLSYFLSVSIHSKKEF